MASLPVKSVSRGIQKAHVRRVQTVRGVKSVLVNPSVRKNLPVKSLHDKYVPNVRPEYQSVVKPSLPVKLRWNEVLKVDDGSNYPIGSLKHASQQITREEFHEFIDAFPTRHEIEWEEEYVTKPLQELNDKILAGELTKVKALEQAKELAKEASSVVENDLQEPAATIVYDDDERGVIGYYDAIEADDFDAVWSGGGYRGYNELKILNDRWKVLHDDNILSHSADSQNLYEFHERLKAALKENDIRFATAFLTSSNLFSTGYTFVVEKDKYELAKKFSDELAKIYRKEEDYLAEVNPFSQGIKDLKDKGMNREDILKRVASQTSDPQVRKLLFDALKYNEL